MLRFLAAFLAAFALASSAHAGPLFLHAGGGAPPVTCAFPVDGGCAAANQNASFTVQSQYSESFAAYAIQDGQTWTSPHPPTNNMAGVDYPVGPDKNTVFKDWTATAAPAGCTFFASGNPNNTPSGFPAIGGPYISCTGVGSNPTFDGWDFTTGGGGFIRISANVGTLTIKNSKFKKGKNNNYLPGYHIGINSSPANLVLKNNLFDGNNQTCTLTGSYTSTTLTITGVGTCDPNATFNAWQLLQGGSLTHTSSVTTHFAGACTLSGGTGSCAIANNTQTGGPDTITVADADWTGAWTWAAIGDGTGNNCIETIEYNAFINQSFSLGNQLGGGCFITFAYNWVGSIGLNPISVVHTSTSATSPLANGQVGLLAYLYNTTVWPAASNTHGTTSYSFLGSTGLYTGYVNGQVIGNTTVTNLTPISPNYSTSIALFDILDVSTFSGTLELHDNWLSPHGSLTCMANTGDAIVTYYVDDGLGGGSYDGVAGNVITVTAISRGAVYVGATIGSNATPYGPVLPYGTVIPGTMTPTTATGQTGSYVYTGTARAVPPSAVNGGKTWDTPITGTLITGPASSVGTNMLDGSAVNIAGTQWQNGTCNGHH